jgi:hypothetical protein
MLGYRDKEVASTWVSGIFCLLYAPRYLQSSLFSALLSLSFLDIYPANFKFYHAPTQARGEIAQSVTRKGAKKAIAYKVTKGGWQGGSVGES